MIVERFRALEVVGFSRRCFLSQRPKRFVNRHELFGVQIMRSFRTSRGIGGFFFPSHAVSELDRFAAVFRVRAKHANIVSIIAILHFFPFHGDVQFFFGYGLEGVGLGQRYPDAGLAFDLWKFNSINELELIRPFYDAWTVSSVSRNRDSQQKYQEN